MRRELILDAAEAVIRARDIDHLTLEGVADEAGVSRALVYNYFGDRQGLLAHVQARAVERLDIAILDVLDPALDPAAQITAIGQAYLEAAGDRALWSLVSRAASTDHPAVRAARLARAERLAAAWGGGTRALTAARITLGVLEGTALDAISGGADARQAVAVACELLGPGLEQLGLEHSGQAPNPAARRS